jgi:hypothetical protein
VLLPNRHHRSDAPAPASDTGSVARGTHRRGVLMRAMVFLFAIPIADSLYRIPVQLSEVLDIVQYVGDAPDVGSAFIIGLHASPTMLRPMRQVHTKLLINMADPAGSYRPVFRGLHAALAVLLLLAFAHVTRPETLTDLAALACALAVLVGLHTFAALVREAYPVNHFLLVTLYGWVVLSMARSRSGYLADATAVLCVTLALLTLELGVLVAVVAFAAHVAGWKGISWRGLLAIAVVCLLYGYLRIGYLDIQLPMFAERPTGFGLAAMSREEQLARFGDAHLPLYGYTIVSGAASVLFSQPRNGVLTLPAAWISGNLSPWMFVQVFSSLAATALVIWYAFTRLPDGRRGYTDPRVTIPAVIIAANAVIGYAYAKDEIVGFSGTFYALAVYAAARALFSRLAASGTAPVRVLVASLACVVMMLWSMRVAGLHYVLREQAFRVRNDWALVLQPGVALPAMRPEWLRRAMTLKREALGASAITPRLLPAWVPAWLGEP